MFSVSLGKNELSCQVGGLPDMLSEYQKRAKVAESFDLEESAGSSVCFWAIRRREDGWPFLVLVKRYSPAGGGFHPGISARARRGAAGVPTDRSSAGISIT